MKTVIDFLDTLARNNNRAWFEANKSQFKAAEGEFNAFVGELIEGIRKFDPTVGDLSIKECTYRIYRDVRFGHNKDPYKSHFGAYIAHGGKKSGFAGYYFHVESLDSHFLGESILASGIHCPQPAILKAIRTAIAEQSDDFLHTLSAASGFSMTESENKLKRVPMGFAADSPMADYLKFKDYSLGSTLDRKMLLSSNLLDHTLEEFAKTMPFISFMNRCVEQTIPND